MLQVELLCNNFFTIKIIDNAQWQNGKLWCDKPKVAESNTTG